MTANEPAWFAQPVPPLGAITSEGIKNPLGRPKLDKLTVLVREAAQNSWDARPDGREDGVGFSLDLTTATGSAWRELFLPSAPTSEQLPLRDVLKEPDLQILFVSDRNTKGLGGSTRGGEYLGARKDYVSFVLNVGVPRDRELGGGTFGFGKAIFYNCSRAQCILVYTRAAADREWPAESRLIGIGLGSSHVRKHREYTGRYWWGIEENGEHVEPLRGPAADEVAAILGFPAFGLEETGTTIAVIGCDLDERTPEEAATRLASAVSWHLWPKMATNEMTFRVTCDGDPVRVPSPQDDVVLGQFASALHGLSSGTSVTRGGKELGRLRLETSYSPRPRIDDVGKEAGLTDGVHHICLMRAANLVVEYRPGDPLPDEHLWYAGVFRADRAHDVEFAAAEPPTHDTWEPAQLEPEPRKVVKYALRKINEALRGHASPTSSDPREDQSGGSLGALSAELGGLMAPTVGGGARDGQISSGGTRTTSTVKMLGVPRWESVNGQDVLVQDFEYSGSRTATVEASLKIVLWGGSGESSSPDDPRPRLLHWRTGDGTLMNSERLMLRREDMGQWSAIVLPVPSTVTSIQVREARRDKQ